MQLALHALTTRHCNCLTEVRLARDLGYEGIEFMVAKFLRYLDQGGTPQALRAACEKAGTPAVCLNALVPADRFGAAEYAALLAECERLSAAAAALGCPTIQLVFLTELAGYPWPEVRRLTARNAAALADIGRAHGIRFQLEPIAWAPMHSLAQTLEVIEEAGRDNLGTVVDFWHLWAGLDTTPDDVARLDKNLIYGVHICDGQRRVPGTLWDEGQLRGFLPGEGDLPVREWVAAVKATGYDGVWSAETYSPRHWEADLYDLAAECRDRVLAYIDPAHAPATPERS
jgi:sugar phosphate isomerase/epimerase